MAVKISLADADAASWASEEGVGSDTIVAASCGRACGGDQDRMREIVLINSRRGKMGRS